MLLDEFSHCAKANREEREKLLREIYLLDRMFVLEYLIFYGFDKRCGTMRICLMIIRINASDI